MTIDMPCLMEQTVLDETGRYSKGMKTSMVLPFSIALGRSSQARRPLRVIREEKGH